MNVCAVFTAPAEADSILHIAGTAFYRIFLNGRFLAAGPARTAKGYLRVDRIPLPTGGTVAVEACGYYCKSVSTVRQPNCILAEITKDGTVTAATGSGFTAYRGTRIQKTERYTIQRHFTEIWDHRQSHRAAEITVLPLEFKLLERRVPYPRYDTVTATTARYRGSLDFDPTLPWRRTRHTWKEIPEEWGVFPEEEIDRFPFRWVWRQKQTVTAENTALPLTLSEGEYALFDFKQIEAGFLTAALEVQKEADLVIAFSEYTEEPEFHFQKMSGHHVAEYLLPQGESALQTFEPYSCRYVMVAVKRGTVTVREVGCRRYEFPLPPLSPLGETEKQREICLAAIRTFAHNAVDLYTDCPSRERGGWLCDSYFTARTEYALTGDTVVEDAFLENYRLFENDGSFPQGVLPDAYPADVRPGNIFIPQWTMWYVLEVEEYLLERGNAHKKDAFRPSVYALLDFYRRYENENGLLEQLPSWNFVEWSDANEWVQDVNYPTNFLYARVLEAIARIYGDTSCEARAQEVRRETIRQSFNGTVFLDHAVRDENGVLQRLEHCSEACQYYAVLFGGLDMNSPVYRPLKELILHELIPGRTTHPEIFPVNAFIGAYLRMDALLKLGAYPRVLADIEGFFGHMSAHTGTLWEYREFKGSMDHGFASYVYAVIKKALYKE